jgi:hypothetical protein
MSSRSERWLAVATGLGTPERAKASHRCGEPAGGFLDLRGLRYDPAGRGHVFLDDTGTENMGVGI